MSFTRILLPAPLFSSNDYLIKFPSRPVYLLHEIYIENPRLLRQHQLRNPFNAKWLHQFHERSDSVNRMLKKIVKEFEPFRSVDPAWLGRLSHVVAAMNHTLI